MPEANKQSTQNGTTEKTRDPAQDKQEAEELWEQLFHFFMVGAIAVRMESHVNRKVDALTQKLMDRITSSY